MGRSRAYPEHRPGVPEPELSKMPGTYSAACSEMIDRRSCLSPFRCRRRCCAGRSRRGFGRGPPLCRARRRGVRRGPAARVHQRMEAFGELVFVIVGVAVGTQVEVALGTAQSAEEFAQIVWVGVTMDHRRGHEGGQTGYSAITQVLENWCGRRDSNPHPLSRSRFSYHFGFRRRLIGVRGLDYPFALARWP